MNVNPNQRGRCYVLYVFLASRLVYGAEESLRQSGMGFGEQLIWFIDLIKIHPPVLLNLLICKTWLISNH